MKRFEIRLQSGAQHSVLDALVQCKQVRMPRSLSGPDDRGPASAKGPYALNPQKEWGNSHLAQRLPQSFLFRQIHRPDKAHRHMQLPRGQPPQTLYVWIESS